MSRHVSNDLKRRARELAAREEIPYSAALARLRTPRPDAARPTDTAADNPSRFLLPEYLYVPFPPVDLRGARPCGDCDGSGLDGEGRVFASPFSDGDRPPLLIEAVCSTCGGCGRAGHDLENGCGRKHTDPDLDPDLDDDFDDRDDEGPDCYSCGDQEFYYVQGLLRDEDGEPIEVIYTRNPCGCTEGRVRVILGDLIEVAG